MVSYNNICDELSAADIKPIDGGNFFQYEDSPLAIYYESFFRWGQQFLYRDDLGLNISPARLFYNPDTRVNACAYTKNGYSLIEINQGMIINLFKRFFLTNNRFDDPTLKDFRNIALLFEQAPAFLIFQNVCLMVFYHETGHLIQQSGKRGEVYREYADQECEGVAVWERHVRELDADWFSANNFAQTILEASYSKNGLHLSLVEFEDFAALMLSSIYIYFIRIAEGEEMYFEQHCHPHPAIRLAFYVQTVLDTLANLAKITLNKQGIANAARHIANVMLSDNGGSAPRYYDELVNHHFTSIRPYVVKIMTDTATYPFSTWRLLSRKDDQQDPTAVYHQ